MAGAAPARLEGHTSQGRIPAPGWLAVNDWQGMRPFDANPWVVDPPSGIVVNTNNRITDAAFPDHLSFDWGDCDPDHPGEQAPRRPAVSHARQLRGDPDRHRLRGGAGAAAADRARPLVLGRAGRLGERRAAAAGGAGAAGRLERRDERASARAADLRRLGAARCSGGWCRTSSGPLQQLVAGAGPGLHRAGLPRRGRRRGLVRRAPDDGEGELRRDGAALARRRADRARGALRGAAGELALGRRAPGAAPAPDARARAGAAASGQHPPEHAGGRPDAPARGRCRGTGRSPISTCTRRGSAAVYDFSDPDSSVFIIATGESGHLLSRHYDDLAAIWRRSEYIPMSLDPGLARAGATGVTRLRPAAGGRAPDAGLSG